MTPVVSRKQIATLLQLTHHKKEAVRSEQENSMSWTCASTWCHKMAEKRHFTHPARPAHSLNSPTCHASTAVFLWRDRGGAYSFIGGERSTKHDWREKVDYAVTETLIAWDTKKEARCYLDYGKLQALGRAWNSHEYWEVTNLRSSAEQLESADFSV